MGRAEDIADAMLVAACVVGIFVAAVVYVLIYGNTVYHRNGVCGVVYRWLTQTVPNKGVSTAGVEKWLMVGIVVFDGIIYAMFIACYVYYVLPVVDIILGSVHKVLPFALVCIPWALFLVCKFTNPGVITAENVEHYLKMYKYDGVLYTPKTINGLQAVARSRWCKYTQRLIAFLPFLTPVGMIITAHGF